MSPRPRVLPAAALIAMTGVAAAQTRVQTSFLESLLLERGDLDRNGTVDGADIGLLLLEWGAAGDGGGDLDGSGVVDGGDLGLLLLNWGPQGIVDSEGWLVPAEIVQSDSRIAFVSEDGDDAAASANSHGRGHYLPSDPEIGTDPTRPVGAILAYRTIAAAKAVLRDASGASLAGEPDWLLLQRGDTFSIGTTRFIDRFTAGRSNTERRIFAAYGDPSLPRPIVEGTPPEFIRSWDGGGNYLVASIEFAYPAGTTATTQPPSQACSLLYGPENIMLEDVRFPQTTGLVAHEVDGRSPRRFELRRCVVAGNWKSPSPPHVQGIYTQVDGTVWIDECVFDLNGYKEDPLDPARWTAGLVSTGQFDAMPAGHGLQPMRTYFDRNVYIGDGSSMHTVIRGSIFSRGGGGGSVQMRQGGVLERNAFLWNESAGFIANGGMGEARWNLVLHDDHLLPPGGFGQGFGSWGGGAYRIEDNVLAHLHRLNNGFAAFYSREGSGTASVRILDNAVYSDHGSALGIFSDSMPAVEMGSNRIAIASGSVMQGSTVSAAATPYAIGDASVGGNLYWSESAAPFGGLTFAQWQASREGVDSASAFHRNFAAFRDAAGWIDPDRDIVSYLEAVDPGFKADEEITVDAGAPADRRRPDAPRVWEVLSDPARYPSQGAFWTARVLTESEARRAARRYHAFLVFIERAKANRKGDWDPAYTADALNNYIREGFGKPPAGEAAR